jgi:hypothetical protein
MYNHAVAARILHRLPETGAEGLEDRPANDLRQRRAGCRGAFEQADQAIGAGRLREGGVVQPVEDERLEYLNSEIDTPVHHAACGLPYTQLSAVWL